VERDLGADLGDGEVIAGGSVEERLRCVGRLAGEGGNFPVAAKRHNLAMSRGSRERSSHRTAIHDGLKRQWKYPFRRHLRPVPIPMLAERPPVADRG